MQRRVSTVGSRFASDACEEFDSLLCAWEPVQGEPVRNWVSPPVPLSPRVVDKLLMECCDFVLIVPQWRSQPWFQALEECAFPRAQLFMRVPPSNVVDGRFLRRERFPAVQCVNGGCALRVLTTFPNACVRCCVERHGSRRQSSSCQGSLRCGPRPSSSSQEPASHGQGAGG